MSTENEAKNEVARTAADFIEEAAKYVNWKPGEEHSEEARYAALRALNSIHAYMATVSLETLRRIDPAAAERVAAHFAHEDASEAHAWNAQVWHEDLVKGEPINPDSRVFNHLTGQTKEASA